MDTTGHLGPRLISLVCTALFVALIGAGLGCGSDNSGSPSSNSFYGMYADESGASGTISLAATVLPADVGLLGEGASTPLTGSLVLPGQAPIELIGQYFTETGALSFSSEGDVYTLNGQVTGATATGSSTGPNGPGEFVLFTGGTPGSVAIYCGNAVCTAPVGCKVAAQLNLAVTGSAAALTLVAGTAVAPAVGTRNGDIVSFHITGEGADITISGVINGTLVGGTWSNSVDGSSGTWSGSSTACSAASAN